MKNRISSIANIIVRDFFAARGMQVKRKDKDMMNDTGGSSKGPDREPHKKPPRDDVKKRHRRKRKTPGQRDTDVHEDKDLKASIMSAEWGM